MGSLFYLFFLTTKQHDLMDLFHPNTNSLNQNLILCLLLRQHIHFGTKGQQPQGSGSQIGQLFLDASSLSNCSQQIVVLMLFPSTFPSIHTLPFCLCFLPPSFLSLFLLFLPLSFSSLLLRVSSFFFPEIHYILNKTSFPIINF